MVKRVFSFMYREVRGLHQAAYILALFAVGSQILAIIRDRLLAYTFGAGPELDLYYAAFRIPDLLFVLFASVLSVYVLLPFVTRATEETGGEAGARVLSQVFTLFIGLYIIVAATLMATAPWYVPRLFSGVIANTETLVLMIQILLLQPFLLGISSLCGIITQLSHRFVLYAISPLLYNLGIIIGAVFLVPQYGVTGLAIGVIIGACGHVAIQLPFVQKSELSFKVVSSFDWRLMRSILRVSIPRALTLSVGQLLLLVLIAMATLMTPGSVSVFQFAFNLQSVPLAIIGMSYSVAAFPTLSTLYAKRDTKGFNNQLLTALRHIIFWSIPIIALVVVLRAQIVRVLLGTGAFDWSDTRLTAAVLAMFTISLCAQAALLLLIRAFYAGGKTALPLYIALVSTSASAVLAWVLSNTVLLQSDMREFFESIFRLEGVLGTEVLILAFAYTCGQLLQLLLMLLAVRSVFTISFRPLIRLTIQAITAAVAGGLSSYATLIFIVDGVNQETFIGISIQGLAAGIMGIIAIVLIYRVLNSQELMEIYRSYHSKIFKTDVIAPQPDAL